MDRVNLADIQALMNDTSRVCVSILLPTQPVSDVHQATIRLKNLTREAERQLTELGMAAPAATALMQPVWEKIGEDRFWQGVGAGLAIYRSPEQFKAFRVARLLEETAMVNDHFLIRPLIPLLNGDGRFYVLALSQNHVRLLRGNREYIQEVPLEDVPGSLAEALNEEPERHFYDRNNAFGAGMAYHGHSEAKDSHNEKLARFFHQVDRGLHKYLKEERAPLILAAVDYLIPIYRQANTYPHLFADTIPGNPEEKGAQELHDRAWPLAAPHYEAALQSAREQYLLAAATTTLASGNLEEIVSAAFFGRIDTLFTVNRTQRFGWFDPEANLVHLHEEAEPGDEELINFAAMQTLLHGGVVFALEPEAMPARSEMAATFRFAMPVGAVEWDWQEAGASR